MVEKESLQSDGIDVPFNFSWATNRILVGSRPRSIADLKSLRLSGVSHLIDVCMDDDRLLINGECSNFLAYFGLTDYLWNPTPDDGKVKSVDWVLTSVRFAMPVLARAAWVIYVHCHDGVNRGPSTAYAILRAQGLSPEQAKLLIRANRPIDWVGIRYSSDVETALEGGW